MTCDSDMNINNGEWREEDIESCFGASLVGCMSWFVLCGCLLVQVGRECRLDDPIVSCTYLLITKVRNSFFFNYTFF